MLTKKTLLTKWGLYALALVLLFAAQQLFLDPIALSPLGASPFLAPMLVAVVAALEGPTECTLFGTAAGILCDLSGGGVFSGVYTFSFFCIALFVAIIAKYWVMRNVFGSIVYALIAFVVIDLIQILYLIALRGAALSAALPLAGREIAASIVFVIPIFFLYNALHKRFRFE